MSKRWTERELRDLQQQSEQSQLPGAEPIVAAFAGNCGLLINEVRRLRGLIVAAGADQSPWAVGSHRPWNMNRDPWCCAWCAVYWDGHGEQPEHSPDCPWPALRAEARAIREEQGRGWGDLTT